MIKTITDKVRNKHQEIFKVLLFLSAVVLVVFLWPKEGKFKYEFCVCRGGNAA